MFRRRHKTRDAESEEIEDLGEDIGDEYADEDDVAEESERPAAPAGTGPWDAGEDVPEMERIDLGGMLIPLGEDVEVQINTVEDQIVAATVLHRNTSAMQVQAFAAPKSSGLWRDVRREILAELKEAGGTAEEADGPFGPELRANVPMQDDKGKPAGTQAVRFVGVDGPRWFLRAVFSGAAATEGSDAEPLEAVLADLVVVRGDSPLPPRDLLELRLPRDAQQALEEQGGPTFNPFERGPEITEVR